MDGNANLQIVLKAVDNASAQLASVKGQLDNLTGSTKQVASAQQETQATTNSLGSAFSNLGSIIQTALGARAMQWVTTAMIGHEQSLGKVALQLKGVAGDYAANTAFVQQYGSVLANASGVEDDFAKETLSRTMMAFKSKDEAVNASSSLLKMYQLGIPGVDMALRMMGDDTEFTRMALMRLAKYMGVDVNQKLDDSADIMEKINRRLKNFGLSDVLLQWGRFKASVNELAEQIGAVLGPKLAWLMKIFSNIMGIPVFKDILADILAIAIPLTLLGGAIKVFAAVFSPLKVLALGVYNAMMNILGAIGLVGTGSMALNLLLIAAIGTLTVISAKNILLIIGHWSLFKEFVVLTANGIAQTWNQLMGVLQKAGAVFAAAWHILWNDVWVWMSKVAQDFLNHTLNPLINAFNRLTGKSIGTISITAAVDNTAQIKADLEKKLQEIDASTLAKGLAMTIRSGNYVNNQGLAGQTDINSFGGDVASAYPFLADLKKTAGQTVNVNVTGNTIDSQASANKLADQIAGQVGNTIKYSSW